MKIGILIVAAVLAATGCSRSPGPIPSRDGTYAVSTEVAYGTYRTYAPRCSWSVQGLHPRGYVHVGPTTIRLDDADTAVTVSDCGKWVEVGR